MDMAQGYIRRLTTYTHTVAFPELFDLDLAFHLYTECSYYTSQYLLLISEMSLSWTHLSLATNTPTTDITAIRNAKIFCSDPDAMKRLKSEAESSLVHEACTDHLRMFLAASPCGTRDEGWRKHQWRAIVRPDGSDRLTVTVISTPKPGTTDVKRYATRWSIEDYEVDLVDTEVLNISTEAETSKDGTGKRRAESLLGFS
jgi:hypothetical protein